MSNIFLNYRRSDAADAAHRLREHLQAELPKLQIFMDVEDIGAGDDFPRVINEELSSCDVLLCIIGRRWLDSQLATGERRLDDPNDFVRIEIETALRLKKHVIPVLVDGAPQLTSDNLPECLREIAYRNSVSLTPAHFKGDAARLVEEIAQIVTLMQNRRRDLESKRTVRPEVDVVAVLIYDPFDDTVALIREERVLRPFHSNEMVVQLPTARVGAQESPIDAGRRLVRQQTGYLATDLQHVITFPAPDTSPHVFLYYVESPYRYAQERTDKVWSIPSVEFARMVEMEPLTDPYLVIAGQWWLRSRSARGHSPLPYTQLFPLRRDLHLPPEQQASIGIRSGALADVTGIDIWLNPESTDMQMDGLSGRSMSAAIRYLGAQKTPNGRMLRDSVANSLRSKLKGRFGVPAGTIIATDAGALQHSNGVKKILHVALSSSSGASGAGGGEAITVQSFRNALEESERTNRLSSLIGKGSASILVPLFGSGQSGTKSDEATRSLIGAAIEFLSARPRAYLRRIHFWAPTTRYVRVVEDRLSEREEIEGPPQRVRPAPPALEGRAQFTKSDDRRPQ